MAFVQKLWNWFKRIIKPTVHLNYDGNKLVGATVHHLDEIWDLDNKQIEAALIFYIEEQLQWSQK